MAPTHYPVWVYVERGVEMVFSRQDQKTLETGWPKGHTEVLGHGRGVMDFSTMSLKRGDETLPVIRYITLTNYIWVVSFKQKEYPLPLRGCILLWILYEEHPVLPFAVTIKSFISGQDVPCVIQFHGDEYKRPHTIINQFNKEKGDLIMHRTDGFPLRNQQDTLKQMRVGVETEWEKMKQSSQYPPPPPMLNQYEEKEISKQSKGKHEGKGTQIIMTNTLGDERTLPIRNIRNGGYVRPTNASDKDKPIYTFSKPQTATETNDGTDFTISIPRPKNPMQRTPRADNLVGREKGHRLVGEVSQIVNPSHPIHIDSTKSPNRRGSIVSPRNETDILVYLKLLVAFLALYFAMKEWV